MMEQLAFQLRDNHLQLIETMSEAEPQRARSQLSSEAMELALSELKDSLQSAQEEQEYSHLSLDDAMKEILAAGGSGRQYWSIDKILKTGDKATGLDTLSRIHQEMGAKFNVENLSLIGKK